MFPSPILAGTVAACFAINLLVMLLSSSADPQDFLRPAPPLAYHSGMLVTVNPSTLRHARWVGTPANLTEPGPKAFTKTCAPQPNHGNPELCFKIDTKELLLSRRSLRAAKCLAAKCKDVLTIAGAQGEVRPRGSHIGDVLKRTVAYSDATPVHFRFTVERSLAVVWARTVHWRFTGVYYRGRRAQPFVFEFPSVTPSGAQAAIYGFCSPEEIRKQMCSQA